MNDRGGEDWEMRGGLGVMQPQDEALGAGGRRRQEGPLREPWEDMGPATS